MNMTGYKISIEIVDILEGGKCSGGHEIGEKFEIPKDRGKICPWAFNSIYPLITMMTWGGSAPWFDEPDTHTLCCPDKKSPVVFKISRKEI